MRTSLLTAALLFSPPAFCVSALCVPAYAQDASTFAGQLSDADLAKREAAAQALAKLGPEAFPALEALLGATKDRAFKVRVAAIQALAAIGPKAGPPSHERLLELLRDKSAQVREEAARAFPSLGLASKSLPQLGGVMIGDQKWRVRAAAIQAVSSTGSAAEPLLEELRGLSTGDPSQTVRKLAAAAVEKIEPGSSQSAPEVAPAAPEEPSWKVEHLGELLKAIRERGDDHFEGVRRLRALGPLGASALPELLKLLKDPAHSEHHDQYVYAIADLGDAAEPAVPVLTARLKLERKGSAFAAAEALGMIGPRAEAAIPALLEAWDATTESSLRRAIARGFAGIGSASSPALERLIAAYPEADREGQEEMGAALAALGPAGGKFLLGRVADSKLSGEERARALFSAAGSRGTEAAVVKAAWLILNSDDNKAWEGASRALIKLSEWSPAPLEGLEELTERAKKETDPRRAGVLKRLADQLKHNQLLHLVVKQDPASPAAIPALIKGIDQGGYWAGRWLEIQAKRNPKVVLALWAHVGQKTKGKAYNLLVTLTGIKHGDPAPPRPGGEELALEPESSGVDLSHVKVGQTYVYDLEAGGLKMVMKYVVERIEGSTVIYSTHTIVMGNTTKSGPVEWKPHDPSQDKKSDREPDPKVKTRDETLEVAGKAWPCRVFETDAATTWVPLKDGVPTFPPLIKTESKATTMTLRAIE